MRGPASRLVTAAAVVVGLAVLVVAGRLLPVRPDAGSPAATTGGVAVVGTSIPRAQVLVPQVVGRTLADARTVMRKAGLPSDAVDMDSQAPGAVVVAQEPPAAIRVPPGSPIGFRTRSDVWPNGVPRRLRLGRGPTTATYRIVAADPLHDALMVSATLPRTVEARVWLEPGNRYTRRTVLGTGAAPGSCRPAGHARRCQVQFAAPSGETPGVWTVGVATRSTRAATVQVTVEFTPPR
jgi:PASTA domain